ncbi:MAG: hypothetical protein MJ252_27880 [archaeon]|nr:hypothetical protein [archaeon]
MNKKSTMSQKKRTQFGNENTYNTLFGNDGCKSDGLNLGRKKHIPDAPQQKSTMGDVMAYDNTPYGYDNVCGKPTQNNYDNVMKQTAEKKTYFLKAKSDLTYYKKI